MKKLLSLIFAAVLLLPCLHGAAAEELITFDGIPWSADQAQVQKWADEHGLELKVGNENVYCLLTPELASFFGMRLEDLWFTFEGNSLDEVNIKGWYSVVRTSILEETMILDEGKISSALEKIISKYGNPTEVQVVESGLHDDTLFRVPEEEYPYIVRDMILMAEQLKLDFVELSLYYKNMILNLSVNIPQSDAFSENDDALYNISYTSDPSIPSIRKDNIMAKYAEGHDLPDFPILNGVWQYRELISD